MHVMLEAEALAVQFILSSSSSLGACIVFAFFSSPQLSFPCASAVGRRRKVFGITAHRASSYKINGSDAALRWLEKRLIQRRLVTVADPFSRIMIRFLH